MTIAANVKPFTPYECQIDGLGLDLPFQKKTGAISVWKILNIEKNEMD